MKNVVFAFLLLGACKAFALDAPSNLSTAAVSPTQINLVWRDNSQRENGFQIFGSRDGVTFKNIATVGRNATRYQAGGLAQGVKYFFKVRAVNGGITSGFSNVSSAATFKPSPTPTPTPRPSATPSATPSPSSSPTVTPAGGGIAQRFPDDIGIANDPEVVFADDFESYTSPSQLTTKWSTASQMRNLRIATEAGLFYSGKKAIEFTLPISATEVANALHKDLSVKQPVLFTRAYMKWDAGYSVHGSNHNGITMSGNYPGAGTAPPKDGTGFFLFMVQNNIEGQPMPGESSPGFSISTSIGGCNARTTATTGIRTASSNRRGIISATRASG
jgi:hypothetical protein